MPKLLTDIQLWSSDRSGPISLPSEETIPGSLTRAPEVHRKLGNADTLTLTVKAGLPIAIATASDPYELSQGKILRFVYDDGSIEEWRITRGSREFSGQRDVTIKAEPIWQDLKTRTVRRSLGNGHVRVSVSFYNQPVSDILASLLSAGYNCPSYFVPGTVESAIDKRINLVLNAATIMEALAEICGRVEAEWGAEYDSGTGNYRINFYERGNLGGGISEADTRTIGIGGGKGNRVTLLKQDEAEEYFSRIVPVAGSESELTTIATANWKPDSTSYLSSVDQTEYNLSDEAIAKDGYGLVQGETVYFGNPSDGWFEVLDTFAPNQIVLSGDATGLDNGYFRIGAGKDELTFLEDSEAVGQVGISEEKYQRPDIPPYPNLIEEVGIDPTFSSGYTGGLAAGLNKISGSEAVSMESSSLFVRHGTASQKVACGEDQGVQTDVITLSPTELSPYFSLTVYVQVESGSVRIELESSADVLHPREAIAETSVNEVRAIKIGGEKVAAGDARVRVVAQEAGTVFYLDAMVLTQSATPFDYVEFMGPKALWMEAGKHLKRYGGDRPDTWTFEAYDNAWFSEGNEIELGSYVTIQEDYNENTGTYDSEFVARVVELRYSEHPLNGRRVKRGKLADQRSDLSRVFNEQYLTVGSQQSKLEIRDVPTRPVIDKDSADLIDYVDQDVTFGATPTFGQTILQNPATTGSHAVRADRTLTITGTPNQISVTGGTQNLTANRSWGLSLPQDIHSGASPTFAGLTLTEDLVARDLTARNLELTGVINYVNENNLYVEDKTITLNRGGTNASSESSGLIIERPAGNQTLLWNSTDGFEFSDSIKASGASLGNATSSDALLAINDNTNPATISLQSQGQSRWWITAQGDPNILSIGDSGVTNSSSGAININSAGWVGINSTTYSGSETLRVAGSSLLEGVVNVTSGGVRIGTAVGGAGIAPLAVEVGEESVFEVSPLLWFRQNPTSSIHQINFDNNSIYFGRGSNIGNPAFSFAINTGNFTTIGRASIGSPSFSGSETLRVAGSSLLEGLVTITDDLIPNQNFSGNIGRNDRYWLTGRIAELYVPKLVVEEHLSTTGGVFYTGIATVLAEDVSSGATSIKTQNNNLSSGDYIRLYARGQFEVMKVTSGASGSGPYTYSVTRNVDGSGANSWNAGDGIFNTGGTAGFGFIEQYAVNSLTTGVSTAGPAVAYQVRTGTGANDIEVRGATGNLKGWYDYDSDIFGAAFGDPSGAWVGIDPTNGFRLMSKTTALSVLSGDTLSMGGDQGLVVKKGERTRIGTDVDIFGNLAVQSYNQVNNPSVSKNVWGWGNIDIDGSGTDTLLSYDVSENAMVLTSDGNNGTKCATFKLDTNRIYRISGRIKKDIAHGNIYIGIGGADTYLAGSTGGAQTPNESFYMWTPTRDSFTDDTNPYFWQNHALGTEYESFTFYVFGQNVDISDVPLHERGNRPYAQPVEEDINWIYVRFLNWNNIGTQTKLYIKDISVTEVGGGKITANTVQTGQLISTNYSPGSGSFSDAGTLIDLDTGLVRTKNMLIDTDGKITFGADVSLSWDNVTDKPDIPELPSYINETFIGATEIKTPTFTGNTATFNTRLNIGAQNFISGLDNSFQWGGPDGILYGINTYNGHDVSGKTVLGTDTAIFGSVDVVDVGSFFGVPDQSSLNTFFSFDNDTLEDGSPAGNNGIAVGSISYINSPVSGRAVKMSGGGSIDLSAPFVVHPGERKSINIWLNYSSKQEASAGVYMIGLMRNTSVSLFDGYIDYREASQNYRINIEDDAGSVYTSGSQSAEFLESGSNYMLTVIFDEDGIHYYVNALWIGSSGPLQNTLTVDRIGEGYGGVRYDGMIDEVRFYNKKLPIALVQDLYDYPDGSRTTSIAGDFIRTGTLVSNNLLYSGGDFTDAGMMIDLDAGIIRSENFASLSDGSARVRGEIIAESGSIAGALTMGSGGQINLPPQFGAPTTGKIDNQGIDLTYNGPNSQRIRWYTGLGTRAGEIRPALNGSGYLDILSSFGINIDGEAGPVNLGSFSSEVRLRGRTYIDNISRSVPQEPNQLYVTNINGHWVVALSTGSAPATPNRPTVCKEFNALRVSWNAVSGATGYDVERSEGLGNFLPLFNNFQGTSFSDADTTSNPSTIYSYRVRAKNEIGNSSYSQQSFNTSVNTATACT